MNIIIFLDNYVGDIARFSASANYFTPVLDRVFQIIDPVKKLFDIGCGAGLFANDANKKAGCELHEIDSSPYALPFESNQFEFCLCKDPLEHLPDREFVVREA